MILFTDWFSFTHIAVWSKPYSKICLVAGVIQPSSDPSLDIGCFFHNVGTLTDDVKFRLLTNHWKPSSSYNFPQHVYQQVKRRFNIRWLSVYPWLAYSKELDGAFCLPCVLFGKQTGHNGFKLDKLYRSPLTNWVSATTKLSEHNNKSEFHRQANLLAVEFKKIHQEQAEPIDRQVSSLMLFRYGYYCHTYC